MNRPAVRFTFGPYALDGAQRRLLRDGAPVALNGKAFDLLWMLVAGEGSAFSREELYERLWPGGIVEDGNLSQNVYLLRRALDPRGDGRRFIETIPRFGYRFVAPARVAGEALEPMAVRTGFRRAAVAAAALMSLTLAGASAHTPAAPLPVTARESYSLGLYHLSLRTRSELVYARAYFEQTARSAPQSADGYAGLAAAEALSAEFLRDRSPQQRRDVALAQRYRDEALRRDSHDSNALAVSGFIAYRFAADDVSAERYLSSALAADPDNAAAHHWHGVLLLSQGRTNEAVADLEAAHRLEPTSEIFSRWLARAYEYAHRPDDAVRMATETLRIEPEDDGAKLVLAFSLEQRGDLRAALRTLETLAKNEPYERPYVIADEARLRVRLQRTDRRSEEARMNRVVGSERVDPFEAALFYLTVGLDRRADRILRGASKSHVLVGLDKYDPRFSALHGSSRLRWFESG